MSVTDIPNKILRLLGLKLSNETSRKRRIDVINEPHIFAKHRRISHDFPSHNLDVGKIKSITNNLFDCHYKSFRVSDDIFQSLSYKSPKSRNNTSMNNNVDFVIADDSDEEDDWGTAHAKAKMNSPPTNFIKSNSKYLNSMSSSKIAMISDSLPGTSNYKSVPNRVPDLHPISRLPSTNSKYSNNLSPMDIARSSFSFEKNYKNPSFFKSQNIDRAALNKPNSIIFETQRKNDRKTYEELRLKMIPHSSFPGKTVNPPRIIKTIDLDKYESNQKLTDEEEIFDDTKERNRNCFSYFSHKKNLSKLGRSNLLTKANSADVPLESKCKVTDQSLDVNPVNTLKEKLKLIPSFHDSWITKLNQRYSDNLRESKKLISEEQEHVNKLTQETRQQEMQLHYMLKDFMIISEVITLPESDEETEDGLPELTNNDHALVKNLLFSGSLNDVIITKFNMNITRRDIKTLYGDSWLNDEVINFYMNLLMEREEKSNQNRNFLKVYAMNTFFIPKLLQSGHSGVKRWTRKVDIFAYDIIPVPVHVGNVHWCMAIIHLKDQTIKYYDSMGQSNQNVLNALEDYLKSESIDKKKQNLDTSNWIIESERNVPQQMNCSDCGVFSCMFAEYLTRSHNITFSQSNMPYFRQKMVLEISKGKLLT